MEQMLARFYSFHIVVMLAGAVYYCKVADVENASPILWAGLSVLVYVITWLVLGWGYLGCLGGQAALFGGITLVRVLREKAGASKPRGGDGE